MPTRSLLLVCCLAAACRQSSAPAFSYPVFTPVTLSTTSAGKTAARITAGAPLDGLVIDVPAGATTEDVTFSVGYASIGDASLKLPSDAHVASYLVQISASGSDTWNRDRSFTTPITVTLPYTPSSSVDELTVDAYAVNANGTLQTAGLAGSDRIGHSVSFWLGTLTQPLHAPPPGSVTQSESTASSPLSSSVKAAQEFATIVAAGLNLEDRAKLGRAMHGSDVLTIDTQFRPHKNGFYIPNGDFYPAPGGSCEGMATFALYYFANFPGGNLFGIYRDPDDTSIWPTDAGQIKLASLAQKLAAGPSILASQVFANSSPIETAYAILGGMYLGNAPIVLLMTSSTSLNTPGHAVLIYAAGIAAGGTTLHVYDPNAPGDDKLTMVANPTAAQPLPPFNIGSTSLDQFVAVGYGSFLADSDYAALKAQADGAFAGDPSFATIDGVTCVGANTKNPCTSSTATDGTTQLASDDTRVYLSGQVGIPSASTAASPINTVTAFSGGDRVIASVQSDQSFQAALAAPPGGTTVDLIVGYVLDTPSYPGYPWTPQHWAGMQRYSLSGAGAMGGASGAGGSTGAGGMTGTSDGPQLTIPCPPAAPVSTALDRVLTANVNLTQPGTSLCAYSASDGTGVTLSFDSGRSQADFDLLVNHSSTLYPDDVGTPENIGVEATVVTTSVPGAVLYCYVGSGVFFSFESDTTAHAVALGTYVAGYLQGLLPH